jgi:tetratricopeptide (TPR) repeat protein
MGIAKHQLGELDEAISILERVIAVDEKSRGSDHPDVALTVMDLANVHLDKGDLAEAEKLFARSLETFEPLGPKYTGHAGCLAGLARVALERGKLDVAKGYYERELEVVEQRVGTDNPRLADVLLKLVELEARRGAPAQSLAHLQRIGVLYGATTGRE